MECWMLLRTAATCQVNQNGAFNVKQAVKTWAPVLWYQRSKAKHSQGFSCSVSYWKLKKWAEMLNEGRVWIPTKNSPKLGLPEGGHTYIKPDTPFLGAVCWPALQLETSEGSFSDERVCRVIKLQERQKNKWQNLSRGHFRIAYISM
jgi:hypothetical protein